MLAGDGLPEGGTNLVTLQSLLEAASTAFAGSENIRIDRSEGEPVAENGCQLSCLQSRVVPECRSRGKVAPRAAVEGGSDTYNLTHDGGLGCGIWKVER